LELQGFVNEWMEFKVPHLICLKPKA